MSRATEPLEYRALLLAALNKNDEQEICRLNTCMVRDGVLLTATGLPKRHETAVWAILAHSKWGERKTAPAVVGLPLGT